LKKAYAVTYVNEGEIIMKNVKRILALTVSAALAVSCFAGCGNGAKKNSDAIVIGCSGPLTGDAAQYGVAVKNAIELAVKDVNDAGGINGTKLSYVFEDDEADSGDKAVNAYNALKDNGMQVMVGTVTTGSCLAVIEKTKQDNIFQLTPSASAQDVIKNSEKKLTNKNCDMICANSLKTAGAGFKTDTNVITLITEGGAVELPIMTKEQAAHRILDELAKMI